ncbi:hypothetical protein [Pseudoxanthomonas japonensis]|uniref:hypothetical protein n=1 Tax=Pseudoxanthomonas japonensis TaxID=69284 RepID=UPI0037499C65
MESIDWRAMNTVISAIFLVVLLAMVLVYPMYFIALSSFGKIMARDHADLVGRQRPSLNESYGLLGKVKAGHIGDAPLSPDAARAHTSARRLLYVGMSLFMAVLFIGLADAMVSKHGAGA